MYEDSVEGFIARWRAHATDGFAFARAEGSPLLEVSVGDAVLQLFERTGPYEAPTGPVRVLVHAVATSWSVSPEGSGDGQPVLAAAGLARLRLAGRVIEVAEPLVVVDAGVHVVLGLEAEAAPDAAVALPSVGSWLTCETQAPAHGFVLRRAQPLGPAASPDDQV
jgi:hypothetical protein